MSLNQNTRVSISPKDSTGVSTQELSHWSLAKNHAVPSAVDTDPTRDLTLISRIYLKYQPERTDRLNRLLHQWQMHENLKVTIQSF